jgi:hypothetical protein
MSVLSPHQQEIWREETVTNPNMHDRASLVEKRRAFALATGLAKALRREARLEAPKIDGLGWNQPSLERAEKRLAEALETLRTAEKGSRDHARASADIRPIRDTVALLRLYYAIKGGAREPRAALGLLRGPIDDALPTLRRQGLSGALEAAMEIAVAAEDVGASPRRGTYAVDEDRLEPLLTSTTGGCIHYTGVRRWAIASLTCNANEKIVRVYEGDHFVYRAIMRFHRASMPGYKGPVLWINMASANGGTEEHHALILRHALEKAKAMGVPVVSSQNDFTEAAREVKSKIEHKSVRLEVDGGNTDALFTDYTFPSDVAAQRGNQAVWVVERPLTVVTPR